MKQGKQQRPATEIRAEIFGRANQMAHESEGRVQRKAMLDDMAKRKKAAYAAGARKMQNKKMEKGANAGTMGGSRSSLLKTFFGS